MADLEKLAEEIRNEGYSTINAEARVCQDIVLKAISESSLSRNVTVKGGVVMRSITGNVRRATQDMDLDFIRYSLSEESIRRFVEKLNCLEGIRIEISGEIEELLPLHLRSCPRMSPLGAPWTRLFFCPFPCRSAW